MACLNFNKRQLQNTSLLEGGDIIDKSTVDELHMCFNFISELPPGSLLSFNKLTFLSLNCNNLTSIPFLAGLPGLAELHLANNRIAKMENLQELANLEFLNLCCNHIKCIENLTENARLKRLSLSGNLISAINLEQLPGTMQSLTFLGLYGNQLSDIHAVLKMLSKAPNLTNLKLGCNPLSNYDPLTISSALLSLPHLTSARLAHISEWLKTTCMGTDSTQLEQSLQLLCGVDDLHVLRKVISVASIVTMLRSTCVALVSIDSEQCTKFMLPYF